MTHVALTIWTLVNDYAQWGTIAALAVTTTHLRLRVQALERRAGASR